MTPGPGEVHVWYRLLDGVGGREESDAWRLLSHDERARADRFVAVDARHTFIHAHALVRTVLSRSTGVAPLDLRFRTGKSGKPALASECGDLEFNLSHTSGLVACAVARTPVGVDVEALDRRVSALELATRFFSPAEVAWLSAAAEDTRQVRFLELWTLKEAYVKGIGAGLSQPLNSFGFGLDALPAIRFTGPAPEESRNWQFALYAPSDRHRLAVAVRCEDRAAPSVLVQPDATCALLGRS